MRADGDGPEPKPAHSANYACHLGAAGQQIRDMVMPGEARVNRGTTVATYANIWKSTVQAQLRIPVALGSGGGSQHSCLGHKHGEAKICQYKLHF